jgi:hypothetical protein
MPNPMNSSVWATEALQHELVGHQQDRYEQNEQNRAHVLRLLRRVQRPYRTVRRLHLESSLMRHSISNKAYSLERDGANRTTPQETPGTYGMPLEGLQSEPPRAAPSLRDRGSPRGDISEDP